MPTPIRARTRSAHRIPDRQPLVLAPGDPVEVGRRDEEWPAFASVTSEHGAGWVPARYLSAEAGAAVVIAAYDTTELPTEAGAILEVLVDDLESGWSWCRAPDGREGWVPDRVLEAIEPR